ncbi:hypothetical protein Scep_014625 [Stephania cephalantha]|uniref:Uncharacterized protein n=1 Tax=Stephania cephalantha TaxID=152367 RepID=A0AAP0J1L5_9MAGN
MAALNGCAFFKEHDLAFNFRTRQHFDLVTSIWYDCSFSVFDVGEKLDQVTTLLW